MDRSTPPRLIGDTYCSRWCGFGCTKAAYDQAHVEADALAKLMGPGWEPRVWENCGWNYDVSKGDAKITVQRRGSPLKAGWTIEGYMGWLNSPAGQVLTQGGIANPRDAFRTVIVMAHERLAALQASIDGAGGLMTDTATIAPAREFDILIRREGEHGQKDAYRAVVVGHEETFGLGCYPNGALQALNWVLLAHNTEKRTRRDATFMRLRHEVRRVAGLPRWTWSLPGWMLPKDAERTKLRDELIDGIVRPFCAANPKATYEEVADGAVAEWRKRYPVAHG